MANVSLDKSLSLTYVNPTGITEASTTLHPMTKCTYVDLIMESTDVSVMLSPHANPSSSSRKSGPCAVLSFDLNLPSYATNGICSNLKLNNSMKVLQPCCALSHLDISKLRLLCKTFDNIQ